MLFPVGKHSQRRKPILSCKTAADAQPRSLALLLLQLPMNPRHTLWQTPEGFSVLSSACWPQPGSSAAAGSCAVCGYTPNSSYDCALSQLKAETSLAATIALLRATLSLQRCHQTARCHPRWKGHLMQQGRKHGQTQEWHWTVRLLTMCCTSVAAPCCCPINNLTGY